MRDVPTVLEVIEFSFDSSLSNNGLHSREFVDAVLNCSVETPVDSWDTGEDSRLNELDIVFEGLDISTVH